jgi:hypothetical protein
MKYLYLNYCDGKIDCKNEREKKPEGCIDGQTIGYHALLAPSI